MEGVHVSEKGLLEYGILMKKSTPPPFLLKTFLLVDDPDSDTVISWNDGGTAFVVWQPAELSRDLLPSFFKHCNFSSFVRQLNTYGFRKVATSRWEFRNDKFQRGKKELLGQIRRRKSWAHRPQLPRVATPPTANPTGSEAPPSTHDEDQRSSSTSSSELNILADENKRLKKENGVLSSELSIMKNKCKELLDLVALYTNQKEVSQGNDGDGDDDDENYEKQPKLFGVRLQVQGERERKRKRSQEFYETATLVLSQSCK